MLLLNERELANRLTKTPAQDGKPGWLVAAEAITHELASGQIPLSEYSLRDAAAALVLDQHGRPMGRAWAENLGKPGVFAEAGGAAAQAVTADAFASINGQVMYNALLQGYNEAETTISQEFAVVPSALLDGEKVAGISNIALPLPTRQAAGEFMPLSPSADYINTPPQRSKGFRVELAQEAIAMDKTGDLVTKCKATGKALAADRELEAATCVLSVADLDSGTLTIPAGGICRTKYDWKGTKYDVYQTSAAAMPKYINKVTGNALSDLDSLNTAYLLISKMLDPYTGLPITFPEDEIVLLVAPDLKFKAERLAAMMQYRTGNITSGSGNQIVSDGKPVQPFRVVVSKYLGFMMDAAGVARTTWFYGSLKQAFAWFRWLDITMSEAVPGSHYMWSHGLVQAFLGQRYESAATVQPRTFTQNLV